MDSWTLRRISVRFLVDGQAQDVIGRVLERDHHQVTLLRRDGRVSLVPVAAIIAAREVPEGTARPRPAAEHSDAGVTAIAARNRLQPMPTEYTILVRDLPAADDPEATDVLHLRNSPDAHWWERQRAAGVNVDDVSAPLCGFLSLSELTARVLINGDWLTIDSLEFEPSAVDTFTELLPRLWAWGRQRGARHAWATVDDADGALKALYLDHGYQEHHRG